MTIKTYVVPAFFLVEAESVERADEIACNVAETTNNLPHGHGHASLRLDECLGTLEAPEDFPGESLLQLDDDEPVAGDLYAAPRRQYREPGSLVVTAVEPREGDDAEYWAVYRKAPAGDEWGDEWVADFREQAAAAAYCKAFAA